MALIPGRRLIGKVNKVAYVFIYVFVIIYSVWSTLIDWNMSKPDLRIQSLICLREWTLVHFPFERFRVSVRDQWEQVDSSQSDWLNHF